MSLGPFSIIMLPVDETGKIHFYNDSKAEIVKANFSRPNIGASSGATVFKNGQLIQIDENVPDWDDDQECPRLLMRPQLQNLNNTADFSYTNYNGTSGTISAASADYNGFPTRKIAFADNSAKRGFFKLPVTSNGINKQGVWVRSLSGNQEIGFAHAGGFTVFGTQTVGEEWQWIEASFNYSGGVSLAIAREIGALTTTGEFEFSLHTLCLGDFTIGSRTIPGNALTRSANQFSFDDLATNSFIGGSGEFSIYFECDNYSAGAISGDNSILFKDAGDANILALWGLANGFTMYDMVDLAYVDNSKQNTKFIITYDGQNIVQYNSAGIVSTYAFADPHVITQILFTSGDNQYDLPLGAIKMVPLVLSEAQALAELE